MSADPKPAWQQVNDLFTAYGLPLPPTRLRDALVMAEWNRRAPVSAGKVKALVWEDFDERRAKAPAMLLTSYLIQQWSDGRFEISVSAPGYSTGFPGEPWHPTMEAAKAAAQADYEARILSALQPGDGWQGIESAKLDWSHMIVAVPDQHRTGWIVGEAYYDPEVKDWFWAGTGANDYFGGPIIEMNHWLPEMWQPMPEPSAPPASLPQGEETR